MQFFAAALTFGGGCSIIVEKKNREGRMIKLIHCADVHLGAQMNTHLPSDKAKERRTEVRATFERMVAWAKEQGVRAVLISGDLFDSDTPSAKEKDYFYGVVKANPDLDFLYLRGNHDEGQTGQTGIDNLKTFSDEWTSYAYGEVVISGIEMTEQNAQALYAELRLDENKTNIVMLHGQEGTVCKKDCVRLASLTEKYIDYLALGHIHSYKQAKLDERGRYAYSGCLEGRGFDETGEKGFVLLEVDEGVKTTFIPFALRTVFEQEVDVSGAKNSFEVLEKVKRDVRFDARHLHRVVLKGNIDFDGEGLADELQTYLAAQSYCLSVKDKTRRQFDVEDFAGDVGVRGEFVRLVLSQSDETLSQEQKSRVVSLGLKLLGGEEVDA